MGNKVPDMTIKIVLKKVSEDRDKCSFGHRKMVFFALGYLALNVTSITKYNIKNI